MEVNNRVKKFNSFKKLLKKDIIFNFLFNKKKKIQRFNKKKFNFLICFFSFFCPIFFFKKFFFYFANYFIFCNSLFIDDFFKFFFYEKSMKVMSFFVKSFKKFNFFIEGNIIYFFFFFLLYNSHIFFSKYNYFFEKKKSFMRKIDLFIPYFKSFFFSLYWYFSLEENIYLFTFNINFFIFNKLNKSSYFFFKNLRLCYNIFFSFLERINEIYYFFKFELYRLISSYFFISCNYIESFSYKSLNFDLFFENFINYLPNCYNYNISTLKSIIPIIRSNELPSYIKFRFMSNIPRTIYGKLEYFKRNIQNHIISKMMKKSHLFNYREKFVIPPVFDLTTYGQPYYYSSVI